MRMDPVDSFRRGHEVDKPHVFRAQFCQQIHRRNRAAARRQHRVNQDDFKIGQVARQAFMIKQRAQTFFLALQADESHPRVRDQLQNGIEHPKSRAQDRHQDHFALQAASRECAPAGVVTAQRSTANERVAS